MKQLKEDATAMLVDAEKALAKIDEAMDALRQKLLNKECRFGINSSYLCRP